MKRARLDPKRPGKRSKYRNVITERDGIKFDSALEAKRYGELTLLLKAGKISHLDRQFRYPLIVGTTVIGHYVADFEYFCWDRHCIVTEDCKGQRLPLYIWKSKHFKAQYGREIVEIHK